MKMSSKTLTVTIPEELYTEVERAREAGHYSRSEFVREALRRFLGVPSVAATNEEIEAIEEGRRAFSRGEYVSLDKLLDS